MMLITTITAILKIIKTQKILFNFDVTSGTTNAKFAKLLDFYIICRFCRVGSILS